MKKLILFISILIVTTAVFAAKDTVRNSGFRYTPDSISITVGDTVVWVIGNSHNADEVDSTTWASNGSTSNNGFSVAFGGGSQVFNTAGKYFYVCTPHASLSMKGIINVLPSTTSIAEEQLESQFSFYPNPAQDQITLELPERGNFRSLEIINQLGQIVYSKELVAKKVRLNLNQFESGIYFIKLRNGEAVLTRKLVIE